MLCNAGMLQRIKGEIMNTYLWLMLTSNLQYFTSEDQRIYILEQKSVSYACYFVWLVLKSMSVASPPPPPKKKKSTENVVV